MKPLIHDLPSYDVGNNIALVALGGISRLPSMTRHQQQLPIANQAPILHESAIAVCKLMGVSEEDYKNTLGEVTLKGAPTPTKKPSKAQLNAIDLDVCDKMNIHPNEYLKTLQENN